MMNDPSHKAMLYFLEVLMNVDTPITVEQLAARFSHKSFSHEMREACGGGSSEGLQEFFQRYPSLFNVTPNGQVISVAIELPDLDINLDGLTDLDSFTTNNTNGSSNSSSSISNNNNNNNNNNHALAFTKEKYMKTKKLTNNEHVINQSNLQKSTKNYLNFECKFENNNNQSTICTHSQLSLPNKSVDECCDNTIGNKKTQRSIISEKNVKTNSFSDVNSKYSINSNPIWNPKSSAIYQPPQWRNIEKSFKTTVNSNCNLYTNSNYLTSINNNPVVSNTCVHCPIVELTCHHCSTGPHYHHHHHHHHDPTSHCHCNSTALIHSPSVHHCHSVHIPSTTIRQPITSPNYCALSTMEKLTLETDAVRFFQQHLIKREEKWVSIKSLAGHLSQTNQEIRSIVGPQLEFRRFLLKHPHVFEIQGDLVSVKDLFNGIFPHKRIRERLPANLHASYSSTNLLNLNSLIHSSKIVSNEKGTRPKSLILPKCLNINQLIATDPNNSDIQSNRRSNPNRRPSHFVESPLTKYVANTNSVLSQTPVEISNELVNSPQTHLDNKLFYKQNVDQNLPSALSLSTDPDLSAVTNPNSLSISMSANEYRAVMFLRKVLEKRGGAFAQPGLDIHDLMQFLSTKAPEHVQSTVGWTKMELKEFISQHNIFFEIRTNNDDDDDDDMNESSEDSVILIGNKRLNRMINIIITGTEPTDESLRTLTNRCGRIFHVARLWGIIDLGKHEHVFFDKSIFRHVDDLQKYFKINEILYFNAILGSKESRAKWRATQVWKECDREYVQNFGYLSKINGSGLMKQITSNKSGQILTHNQDKKCQKVDNDPNRNDDTEADEEIEDSEVDSNLNKDPRTSNINSRFADETHDSDLEYALGEDDELEEDEPLISALAREEGLHLANDIKFLADEEDQEIERVLRIKKMNKSNLTPQVKTNDESVTENYLFGDLNKDGNYSEHSQVQSEPYESNSVGKQILNCERPNSLVYSPTYNCKLFKDKVSKANKPDSGTSSSLSDSNVISIAVQTLSTGDIMATQLYHGHGR